MITIHGVVKRCESSVRLMEYVRALENKDSRARVKQVLVALARLQFPSFNQDNSTMALLRQDLTRGMALCLRVRYCIMALSMLQCLSHGQ